jgi:uncharacterized membrane protein YgcG
MNFTRSRLSNIIAEEHDMLIREKETGVVSKTVHTALDLIGLVPVYGEWADIANAAIHAREGNYLLAALSAISVVPVVGDAIGKGGKVVVKLRKLFPKAMKGVEKYGPEAAKGVRAMRSAIRKNKKAIDKFLDVLEEDGHLSNYIDGIRGAIDVLASGDRSDEDITAQISGEMDGTRDDELREPDAAEVEARKSSDSKNIHLDLSISDERDEEDERGKSNSSGGGGSVGSGGSGGGSWGPFGTDGTINPEYLKFEKLNIDDMIREETSSVLSRLAKDKTLEEDDDGNQTGVNLDPDEENADDKAPNLNTSNQTPISAIGEGDEDGPSDAMRKLAGSDDIASFLQLKLDNRGNSGNWIVKKLGDRRELEPTPDFARALSKWFIHNERDSDWTIEFREEREEDPILEVGSLGGHLDKKQVAKEFQEAITTALRGLEDEQVTQIFNDWMAQSDQTELTREALRNMLDRANVDESKKITKGMVLQMLQEEYQNVLKEYGMETPYDRDDDTVAGKTPWSPTVGWGKELWDISEELQDMIRTKYHIDDDDIFEVALEQPPDSDNYMIRVQWEAEAPQVIDSDDIPIIDSEEIE